MTTMAGAAWRAAWAVRVAKDQYSSVPIARALSEPHVSPEVPEGSILPREVHFCAWRRPLGEEKTTGSFRVSGVIRRCGVP